MLNRNVQDFWRRLLTVDEIWIHYYTPETKQQSKQWVAPGESAPKMAETVSSAGKVMATVCWYAQGIILIDYLQKGKQSQGNIISLSSRQRTSLHIHSFNGKSA